jgi:hypothetical protein
MASEALSSHPVASSAPVIVPSVVMSVDHTDVIEASETSRSPPVLSASPVILPSKLLSVLKTLSSRPLASASPDVVLYVQIQLTTPKMSLTPQRPLAEL